jgi:hypothetical protein
MSLKRERKKGEDRLRLWFLPHPYPAAAARTDRIYFDTLFSFFILLLPFS